MSNLARLSLSTLLVLVVAACSAGGAASPPASDPGGSGGPSAQPSGAASAPSASPEFGAIEHKTGATDVLLRLEEGGGFMMPAFTAAQAPQFTLYGDGTFVFRNPTIESPAPVGSVMPLNPYRTAKLSEEQIQELLTFAIAEGGLGTARANYGNDMIADASTTIFTLDAGGLTKVVSVYALGLEMEGIPDLPARASFKKLADRLTDFDQSGTFATDVYVPAQYRGVLLEGQPGAPDVQAWPWPEVKPADFAQGLGPEDPPFPSRVMSADEIEALALDFDETGGFMGLPLTGPDGKAYAFALRPLLPDETR